jgi:hypothetical protein
VRQRLLLLIAGFIALGLFVGMVAKTIMLMATYAHAAGDDSRVSSSILEKEVCHGIAKWSKDRVEIVVAKDMPHPNCIAFSAVAEQILNTCPVGSICDIDADVDKQGIREIWSIERVPK